MTALQGKTIVVTRAVGQAEDLINALKQAGAKLIHIPTIEVTEPDSWNECDSAIEQLRKYDWVVFSSTNGVERFFSRLRTKGLAPSILNENRVAAVGKQTASELRKLGVHVELVPEHFNAEGLLHSFRQFDLSGQHILLARAQEGRELLEQGLRESGAVVDIIAVYKTQAPKLSRPETPLNGRDVDVLTFTSPSTFRNFVTIFGRERVQAVQLRGCRIAAIGPVTADAIVEDGFAVDIVPSESTANALVAAISEYYQ